MKNESNARVNNNSLQGYLSLFVAAASKCSHKNKPLCSGPFRMYVQPHQFNFLYFAICCNRSSADCERGVQAARLNKPSLSLYSVYCINYKNTEVQNDQIIYRFTLIVFSSPALHIKGERKKTEKL